MKTTKPTRAGQGRIQQASHALDQWRADKDLWSDDDWDDDKPVDPEASPLSGTLSHCAAMGDIEAMKSALAASPGFDVNEHGPRLETPLHSACQGGSLPCVELLLEHGADPDAMNHAGHRPMDWAAMSGWTPMGEAKRSGQVIRLLASRGARVDEPSPRGGLTPFLRACKACDLDAAQALAELGADMRALSPEGEDAFDMAHSLRQRRGPGSPNPSPNPAQTQFLGWLAACRQRDALLAEPGPAGAPAPSEPRIRLGGARLS